MQVVNVIRKALPVIAKQLPKLWPLLLEKKNRERIVEAGKDLASQSPTRRLRARIEVTAVLADQIAAEAKTDDERQHAEDWARRARNLSRKLEMPMQGRDTKAQHRATVAAQLDDLQAEMNAGLDG